MEQFVQYRPDFPAWRRTSTDELVNATTHGLGFVVAVVGSAVMMDRVLAVGSPQLIIGCGVYLASLMAVYAMSTLSHSATSVRWKSLFRQLDQAFIYLLIVGTYTPFSIAYLHGPVWAAMLATMWCVAIVGFISKTFFAHRVETVSVVSYVILGWMPIVAVPTLFHAAPAGAFQSMIAGGMCYTVGTLFLIYDEHVKHFHAAWHLCVMSGSACHFFGLLFFVIGGVM
ncbi:MAG: hemolysin III family protein [Pirellulales bacterium]